MKLLATIRDKDVTGKTVANPSEKSPLRRAARAIVFDGQSIALLYVSKHGYHKLPGGGIEDGEAIAEALERETREEVGCRVKVGSEIGQINEFREEWGFSQESMCYSAILVGDKGRPDFTDVEQESGFEIVWVESIDRAIDLLESDRPQVYEGRFIRKRDLIFLEASRALSKR